MRLLVVGVAGFAVGMAAALLMNVVIHRLILGRAKRHIESLMAAGPAAAAAGDVMRCVGCGCTDGRACAGGCSWVVRAPPVCSRCWQALEETIAGGPARLNALPGDHPAVCRVADALLEQVVVDDDVPFHYWDRTGRASCGARLVDGAETFSATTERDAVTCTDCEQVLAAADARARGELQ